MIERPLLLILLAALAGCAVPRPDFNAQSGDDAALRHPVVLQQGWQELGLPVTPHLDERSRRQIDDFVADWHRSGTGPVYIRMPLLVRDEKNLRDQFLRLQGALAESGYDGRIKLLREPFGESSRTPQIILSFARMKAQIATRCGEWPDNLASSAASAWQNRVHADFGCAYQTMIAAQTADPRYLVSPSPATPADAQMRVRALNRLRNDNTALQEGPRN